MIVDAKELASLMAGMAKAMRGDEPAANCHHGGSGEAESLGVQIVILQRGWVVVGRVTRTGDQIAIDGASIVRRWGTTKGLGQLATDGPQPNTVLDPTPTVACHQLAVVGMVKCVHPSWGSRCSG